MHLCFSLNSCFRHWFREFDRESIPFQIPMTPFKPQCIRKSSTKFFNVQPKVSICLSAAENVPCLGDGVNGLWGRRTDALTTSPSKCWANPTLSGMRNIPAALWITYNTSAHWAGTGAHNIWARPTSIAITTGAQVSAFQFRTASLSCSPVAATDFSAGAVGNAARPCSGECRNALLLCTTAVVRPRDRRTRTARPLHAADWPLSLQKQSYLYIYPS